MSLTTWRDEFYPVPASQTTPETAVAHSLQKWLGLDPSNLARHAVHIRRSQPTTIIDDSDEDADEDFDSFPINADTCALCEHHFKKHDVTPCGSCPLFKHLGTPCDEELDGPYQMMRTYNNPQSMIAALRAIS